MFLSIYHDIFRPHLFLRLLQLRNYLRATLRGLLVHMPLLLRTNSISSSTSDMQIFLLHSSPLSSFEWWDRFVPFFRQEQQKFHLSYAAFFFSSGVTYGNHHLIRLHFCILFTHTGHTGVPHYKDYKFDYITPLELPLLSVQRSQITSMTQLFRFAAYLKHRGGEGQVGLREAQRYRLLCSVISFQCALWLTK
jgi:hypothetical protein